jgi:NADPH:quinone reductase-like Zn-dependent oxidoreductase
MKALRLVEFGLPPRVELFNLPEPEPGPGEVVVELHAAAVNRRDVWVCQQYEYCPLPVTLGSDGAGVIVDVGAGVSDKVIGEEVVVNPTLGWGDSEDWPGPAFDILGAPADGTFAERIVLSLDNLARRPEHLDWGEASALSLAGLTAWRAISRHAKVSAGTSLLVTGIGGGVAAFALQIAVGLGARVFVTSSTQEKLEKAKELGAVGGFDYTDESWPKALRGAAGGGVDAVVDSSGGPSWGRCLEALRDGGVLVTYGDTLPGPAVIDVSEVYWHWRSILGTSMGSPRDHAAFLSHATEVALRPVIDSVYPLRDAAEAFARLASPDHFGKVVISIRD